MEDLASGWLFCRTAKIYQHLRRVPVYKRQIRLTRELTPRHGVPNQAQGPVSLIDQCPIVWDWRICYDIRQAAVPPQGVIMFRPGPEWIVVLLVVLLLIFGAKRLPDIGSSLGKGIRTFKSAVTGEDNDSTQETPVSRNGRDDETT